VAPHAAVGPTDGSTFLVWKQQVEINSWLKYAVVQIDCKGTRARSRAGTTLAEQRLVVFSGSHQFATKLEFISDKPIQEDEFQVRCSGTTPRVWLL
jgi:hypothetical protein